MKIKDFLLKLTRPRLAIDLSSMTGITIDGKNITPLDVISIYNKTGYLFYASGYGHGNPPIVISTGFMSQLFSPKIVDISKLTNEELEKLINENKIEI